MLCLLLTAFLKPAQAGKHAFLHACLLLGRQQHNGFWEEEDTPPKGMKRRREGREGMAA